MPRKPVPAPSPSGGERRLSRQQERHQLKAVLQIGGRLRQMRSQHAMTQAQVASMLELNRTAYTHYENGVNMPDVLTLVRLAGIYEVSPGELVQYLITTEEAAGQAVK